MQSTAIEMSYLEEPSEFSYLDKRVIESAHAAYFQLAKSDTVRTPSGSRAAVAFSFVKP